MFAGLRRVYLDRIKYLTTCNVDTGNYNQLLNALFWLSVGFQLAFYNFTNVGQVFSKLIQSDQIVLACSSFAFSSLLDAPKSVPS